MTPSIQIVDGSIEGDLLIGADPERVFAALTSPQELMTWWGSSETYSVIGAEVDRRNGGDWKIEAEDASGRGFSISATILHIDPPILLHLRWATSWAPDRQSDVEIRLRREKGGTRLSLRHSGLGSSGTVGCDTHYWAWRSVLIWLSESFENPNKDVGIMSPAVSLLPRIELE